MPNLPFTWPDCLLNPSALARFFRGFPWLGPDRRAYAEFRKSQSLRDEKIIESWSIDAAGMAIKNRLDEILVKEMKWLNGYFLPDDPCGILFYDPSLSMDSARALLSISSAFQVDITGVDLSKITYSELVDLLRSANTNR